MFLARRNLKNVYRHPWHFVVVTAITLSAPTLSLAQSDFSARVPDADESVRINMHFVEDDIRECINTVSAQARHIPIILGPQVSGSVSCVLRNHSLDDALQILCDATGSVWKRTPHYYFVSAANSPHRPKGQPGSKVVVYEAIEEEIQWVLEEMSVQTGTTLVADPNVRGLVTVALVHTPLEIALDMVCAASDSTWSTRSYGYLISGPTHAFNQRISINPMIKFPVITDKDALLSSASVKDRLTRILHSVSNETERHLLVQAEIEEMAEAYLRGVQEQEPKEGVFRYNRFMSHQRRLSPNTVLHIRNPRGDIRITGMDTMHFSIAASIHVSAQTDEQAKALLAEFDFELRADNNHLHVTTSDLEIQSADQQVSIDYALTVPRNISIHIANGGGKVTLENLKQPVHLEPIDPLSGS